MLPFRSGKKISKKFLLIFSCCLLSVAGVVWACADGDYDDGSYSNFSPEAFVAPQYSPFFYTSSVHYYGEVNDNSNTRYNTIVAEEWRNYLKNKISKKDLNTMLFKSTDGAIDSLYNYYKGKTNIRPSDLPDLRSSSGEKETDAFLNYLKLAKACEHFAVREVNYWDDPKPAVTVSAETGASLLKAFNSTSDQFIKQRLWFQLVRYYYFRELAGQDDPKSGLLTFFNAGKNEFPKNMNYYRALGYVAGHYYKQKDYATANYLYSLAYNFSSEMKIPSNWSFHPQNESDWQKSLQMAKSDEEKITLWQMMGVNSDASRAIGQIYLLNPKSEKLDLLLSRLVNISESGSYTDSTQRKSLKADVELVSRIAKKNNTVKPYFWNLAAGYLNTLAGNYTVSKTFYNKAKTQLPKNDKLIAAQYKILDWTLYLSQLKKIDARAESEMTEPINWLADLSEGKDTVKDLRFNQAIGKSVQVLSELYRKQGEELKANCFDSKTSFYTSNQNIEALKALMSKPVKTPFEKGMLRYYHFTMEDLYYHQALMLVYKEKIDQAVPLMEKAGKNGLAVFHGNPFTIRIADCHDCDFAAPQKKKYTPLSFVKTIQALKTEIAAGKNVYNNAYLLANAYYNITHYGNSRLFYQTSITSSGDMSPMEIPSEFRTTFTSGKLAEKYYLLARANAVNAEQKARCTYMAAKCERNEIYNSWYKDKKRKLEWEEYDYAQIPKGKYFLELKTQFNKTQYYNEVLQECGYFKKYAAK